MQVAKLLDIIGTPQMEEEIERRVLNNAKEEQSVLLKRSGVETSLTEHDMRQYLGTVLKEIKVLKNIDEILKKGKDILDSSNDFMVCSGASELRLAYNNHFNNFKMIIDKYKNGEHNGIKIVTTIVDNDGADLVKKFLDIGVQIRHVENIPPIDFAVSDKEMIATTEKTAVGDKKEGVGEGTSGEIAIRKLLVSNEQAYISHFVFIFNELWKDGIDARKRILTIEQGIEPEFVEVIRDPKKAKMILIDLVKSVKKEALFLLPNDIGMIRAERMGLIDHLIKASQENHAVVKIICPLSNQNSDIVKRISNDAPNIKVLNGTDSSAGMFLVDNTKYFRAELKDPQSIEFDQAIAFPIYSNSKTSVQSFRSIFEILWNERVLNEELKGTEAMQKEFINIAAHELRNPIQPILGLSNNLLSQEKGDINEYREQLNIIYRNARRLQRLTDDILDVSKIQGQMLKLNKSRCNLKEVVANTIADFKTHLTHEDKHNEIKLDFESRRDGDIFIYADPDRITQVISNLLSNAVKFTEKGSVVVTINIANDNDNAITTNTTNTTNTTARANHREVVVVSVRDTGKGVDPSIKEKLFEKFETRSGKGIGLGLYISRNIIEAHGGKIWAENNGNEKGTTFLFSLPVSN
jgi:signal transduction histidine kinase